MEQNASLDVNQMSNSHNFQNTATNFQTVNYLNNSQAEVQAYQALQKKQMLATQTQMMQGTNMNGFNQ
jgi:hypothetical protein